MAKLVEILSVCDLCAAETAGARVPATQTMVLAFDRPPFRELDLCDTHAAPFSQLQGLAVAHGLALKDDALPKPRRKRSSGEGRNPDPLDTAQYRDAAGLYHCPECEFTTAGHQGLGAHYSRRHGRGNEQLPCPQCGRVCQGPIGLTSHIAASHSGGDTTCPECGKQFASRGGLAGHLHRKHGRSGPITTTTNTEQPTLTPEQTEVGNS